MGLIRDTIWLNYLGHHIHPLLFILSPHRGPDLRWTQTPCDARLSLNLGNMRFRLGTHPLIRLNIQGIVAFSWYIMFSLPTIVVAFVYFSLKSKPELSFLTLDYKSFICVSSVWSTWEAKTFSRDTRRNVAGSTHQPMKSTGKMTFLYLRLAPFFYHNKANWMGSGVVVKEGGMGAGWKKTPHFLFSFNV